MQIEFVPHIGKARVQHKGRDKHKTVEHNQDQIMLDGKRAGYIGREPGSPICLIRTYTADVEAAIERAVADRLGQASETHRPPKPNPDVAHAEIEFDDELDDEELEDAEDDDEQFD